jgi:hypothetical protein
MIKQYIGLFKKSLYISFLSGSLLCLIPNKINLKVNQTKFNRINLPIIGGFLGVGVFLSSPFLIINYLINRTYLDKLYDKFNIDIKRYHQYDGNNNKYAYPSIIMIEINKK